MTENAIKFQELEEKKRSNKVREKQNAFQPFKDITSGLGNFAKGAGTLGKTVGTINDASWYNSDKQLVKDSASISFDNPLGAPFSDAFQGKRTFPGIMSIELGHTIGDKTAILHAAQNIYSFVRHANSGSRNYQPNDLITYLISMADVFSYHAWMCRLYSECLTAKGHNRYYFNTLIEASGGNPYQLRNELAQFRTYINTFAIRANSYFVPKDLTLFQRRYWLYSNIFKDKEIHKSQVYVFNPYCLGIYDDTTSTLNAIHRGDTRLGHEGFSPNGLATLSSIVSFGDRMLNAILESADVGIMAGDILKAYGEGNLHYLPSIPEDYHVEAIFSMEVLSQIHNTVLIGNVLNTDVLTAEMFTIRCPASGYINQGLGFGSTLADQNKSNLYMYVRGTDSITLTSNNLPDASENLLNMYKDDVTPDEVMVATRLMVAGSSDINDQLIINKGDPVYLPDPTGGSNPTQLVAASLRPLINIVTNGTEVAVKAIIWTLDPNTQLPSSYNHECTYRLNSSNNRATIIDCSLKISKFDWCPSLKLVKEDSNDNNRWKFDDDFIEAANYASISKQTLKNIHYTAMMSEYGVPLLGLKVRSK